MTPEELRDYSDLQALGVLDPDERSELREAAAVDPQTFASLRRGSVELVSRLANFVKIVEPPARLRARVISMVTPAGAGATIQKRGFGWGLVFATSSVLLLALSGLLAYQINRLSVARRADNARFAEATALMAAPDTREVVFGTGKPRPPQGRVFVNGGKGFVLLASNLTELGPDKTYEMWVIPKGQKPVPSGLFRSRSDGSALHYEPGVIDTANVGAFAVSVEPAGGSAQPSTQPIIVAAMAP